MAKSKHIMIRVSEDERERLRDLAGTEGVSAYLLRKAFEGTEKKGVEDAPK